MAHLKEENESRERPLNNSNVKPVQQVESEGKAEPDAHEAELLDGRSQQVIDYLKA